MPPHSTGNSHPRLHAMDDLPYCDTSIHSPVPLLDQLLSPSLLITWPVESFPLSPASFPNNDFGRTSHQIAAPLQENVPSSKVDVKESLSQDLVALISDCRELGEMVHYIPCVGEVHFEVYGSHGNLQHGFIYLRNHHEGRPPQTELKLHTDLRDKNYDWIKNLSDKYTTLMVRYEAKFIKDTLSNCITPSSVGSSSIRVPAELELVTGTERRGDHTGHKKTGRAAQRERTRHLRREDLVRYFHLPRESAARELNLSVKMLTKICRKNEISRWPYVRPGTRK